jgi:oligosaccharyl transferase complex subunit OST4
MQRVGAKIIREAATSLLPPLTFVSLPIHQSQLPARGITVHGARFPSSLHSLLVLKTTPIPFLLDTRHTYPSRQPQLLATSPTSTKFLQTSKPDSTPPLDSSNQRLYTPTAPTPQPKNNLNPTAILQPTKNPSTTTTSHQHTKMITDNQLYTLSIFLGSAAMLMIVLYHFLEVNSSDEPVTLKEKEGVKAES